MGSRRADNATTVSNILVRTIDPRPMNRKVRYITTSAFVCFFNKKACLNLVEAHHLADLTLPQARLSGGRQRFRSPRFRLTMLDRVQISSALPRWFVLFHLNPMREGFGRHGKLMYAMNAAELASTGAALMSRARRDFTKCSDSDGEGETAKHGALSPPRAKQSVRGLTQRDHSAVNLVGGIAEIYARQVIQRQREALAFTDCGQHRRRHRDE